jgi:Flp pilus assembly protein TadD
MRTYSHSAAVAVFSLVLTACAHTDGAVTSQSGATAEQDRDVYLSLVSAIEGGGKPQAALAFLDEYLVRYPNDDRALLLRGDAYFKSGQLDAAAKTYQGLLAKGSSPAAEFGLGRVKAAQGDWSAAVSYLGLAYRHSPADPNVLNDYGYALLEVSQAEQAYQLLGRAYELRPNDQIIRNNFVLAAERSGRTGRVEDIVRQLDRTDQATLRDFIDKWSAQTGRAGAGSNQTATDSKGQ